MTDQPDQTTNQQAEPTQLNCVSCNSYKLMLIQVEPIDNETRLSLVCDGCGMLQELKLTGAPNLYTVSPTKKETTYLG